ncbi:hypothetical protein EV643_12854 [Kribbella sp. VKM Ac-2527]|uniref:Uncharacterized protein n=1 Tax=Kribbella caucasensis TaxID=2512215 RepID=A0A4R6JEJ4_9ACTN|nr:hypothetical protein [Kribbella sp. VKM Ac-2527]TDO34269.1 hypothetical protein EV643_12854 [Kribbella sp. VKM Ac-2527]
MDEVKKLLEQFADHTVDGLPPADVDADVVRGRRALRRIRARRGVAGVLCAAAVTTAVLIVGNQADWWVGGEAEVATESATPSVPGVRPSPTAAATPAQSGETMSMYDAAVVQLVTNKETWNPISCTLVPQGWTATPGGERVVLTPPSVRTSDTAAGLELFGAAEAQRLTGIRATEADGKVFHLGSLDGRAVGQVKLGDRWLVVRLPVEHQDWTDELVQRFLNSCTLS